VVGVLRHETSAKQSFSSAVHPAIRSMRGVSMHDVQNNLAIPAPSIAPTEIPAMTDDECLIRLAQFVERHDSAGLEEVARLIGRLVVTIE
jgi:hypothetical protein